MSDVVGYIVLTVGKDGAWAPDWDGDLHTDVGLAISAASDASGTLGADSVRLVECRIAVASPQVAPTEPPAVDVEPLRRIIERARGVQVTHPWTDANYAVQALIAEATALCDTLAAPQVAPEPERCPRGCRDGWLNSGQGYDDYACPDPWHRPAPLVEGEQG